jgi:cytochrome c oxidase subunit II
MHWNHRPRRSAIVALTAVAALMVAACAGPYPNTTFSPHSEFGREIDALWNRLLFLGTVVFIFVEGILLYTIIRYRRREGQPDPAHVHGNTTLELLWTTIPALILVFIAIPTVRTIFRTEARATPNALQVEVIGHQWWWEFRYPQYGVVTANELYLPVGRTANFTLKSADVIHSFWIPQMGGKRDVVSNRTNYLWFTPDSSLPDSEWNGTCNEYCGESHANMRFRVFTVQPAEFERWAAHQREPAMFGVAPAAPAPDTAKAAGGKGAKRVMATPAAMPPADSGWSFPHDKLATYSVPLTTTPPDLRFTAGLVGDPARGKDIYSRSACIGCHTIKGNPMSLGVIGPNLTHIASRTTIAAGLYPNDAPHLELWIKNARAMKPGATMNTLGKGQYDPIMKMTVNAGGLDDQQIADIVAYLQALK